MRIRLDAVITLEDGTQFTSTIDDYESEYDVPEQRCINAQTKEETMIPAHHHKDNVKSLDEVKNYLVGFDFGNYIYNVADDEIGDMLCGIAECDVSE